MTTEAYEFDEDFQTLILAYLLREASFSVRTNSLIKPQYFESEVLSALSSVALDYYNTYKTIPSKPTLSLLIKDAVDKRILKKELLPDVKAILEKVYTEKLSDIDSTVATVVKFARRQELSNAIIRCADLIDKGKYDDVDDIISKAALVGQNDDGEQYDYFKEAENRFLYRQEVAAGRIKPDGVTTGFKGWGRSELSVIMGAPKAGKSMSLISFGIKAALAGYNVLYVSLEVSRKIIADRMDANIAGVKINDLVSGMKKANDAAKVASVRAGTFKIHDYPSGSFSPGDLKRLLHRYKAHGINFDMVIVDYADLMRPDRHSDETRENSRLIYIGLRAIAQEFNVAMLSATQTNREGIKGAVSKMEHVSEDINKVRTVDLLLSINATEAERKANAARIHFVASRNQDSSVVLKLKTNLAMARFLEGLEVEDDS
jgi:replicative DNA helicase